MDSFDDDLKSHLAGSAAAIGVEPAGIDEVERLGRRRGHRRRAYSAVAVVAVVALGAVGLGSLITDGETTLDVAAGLDSTTTTVASGSWSADQDSSAGPAVPSPSTTAAARPADDTASPVTASFDLRESGYYGGGTDWVVPWGEGFLSFGTVWEPAPVPEFTAEVLAAFPPEIADVITSSGASTVEGAMGALQDAGLLDEATDFIMNDPELMELVMSLGGAGGTSRFVAQTSPDGKTWTDLSGFATPMGTESVSQVVSDGSHLVVAIQNWSPGSNKSSLHIAVTTDLTNWQTYDLAPPSDIDTPSFVQSDRWLSGLTIGPDGWLARVEGSSYVNLWELLPPEVRQWPGGVNFNETADGLEVVFYEQFAYEGFPDEGYGEFPPVPTVTDTTVPTATVTAAPTTSVAGAEETVPLPAPVGQETVEDYCCGPTEQTIDRSEFYSWAELGIDPVEMNRYRTEEGESYQSAVWVGPWNGTPLGSPTEGTLGEGLGQVFGTEAGFLALSYGYGDGNPEMRFSSGGITWTDVVMPTASWIGGITAVDGGVLITGGDSGQGTKVWLGAPDGTGWVEVELPGLVDGMVLGGGNQSASSGLVAVVDVTDYSRAEPPPVEFDIGFEQDGQEIHLYSHADGTADLVVTDLATGEIVADLNGTYDGLSASFARIDSNAVVIVDPDGNEIVSVPMEVILDQLMPARQAAIDASGWTMPEPAEFVLVASANGIDWLATPLSRSSAGVDEYGSYPSTMGINGNLVVVRIGGEWQSYNIG